MVVPIEGTLIH